MKILVSNDDGYRAEGIAQLRAALATLGEVTVIAPDRNRSGAGNSLTLDVPLRLFESEPGVYFVAGTPTDCVHLGISGVFDFEFDMVASGINDGANLGDDVLYSGTVAAAIEGRFLGLPAMALSLCTSPPGRADFDTAARVAETLVPSLLERPLDPTLILNVNMPDRPFEALGGFAARGWVSGTAPRRSFRRATRRGNAGVLDRSGGRGQRCRAGHRFQGGRGWLRVGDAAVDRLDAPCGIADGRALARCAMRGARHERSRASPASA